MMIIMNYADQFPCDSLSEDALYVLNMRPFLAGGQTSLNRVLIFPQPLVLPISRLIIKTIRYCPFN